MKESLNKENIINIDFYGGLIFKAVNALIEVIGDFIIIVLNHEGTITDIWYQDERYYALVKDFKDISQKK